MACVFLCHSTFILTKNLAQMLSVSYSHDIVFSHDPLGNVLPKKAAQHYPPPTKKK